MSCLSCRSSCLQKLLWDEEESISHAAAVCERLVSIDAMSDLFGPSALHLHADGEEGGVHARSKGTSSAKAEGAVFMCQGELVCREDISIKELNPQRDS